MNNTDNAVTTKSQVGEASISPHSPGAYPAESLTQKALSQEQDRHFDRCVIAASRENLRQIAKCLQDQLDELTLLAFDGMPEAVLASRPTWTALELRFVWPEFDRLCQAVAEPNEQERRDHHESTERMLTVDLRS